MRRSSLNWRHPVQVSLDFKTNIFLLRINLNIMSYPSIENNLEGSDDS